jgi:hydroxylysine kinase
VVEIDDTAVSGGPEGQGDAFTVPPADLAPEEAEALAHELFGIAGRAQRLTSERDLNFHLRSTAGAQFVLKIANAAEPERAIGFQNHALRHLEREDPGLPVPRIVSTRDGRDCVRVSGCLTRLLTWIDGPLMHQKPRTSAMRRALGRMHARLHRALGGLSAPVVAEPLLWDLQYTAKLEPLLPHIAPDRRGLVDCALQRFKTRVAPALGALPGQVVHNDLNPHNVVVSEGGDDVVGIIDFGDMVHAPRICDVAVAAAYHVRGEGDPFGDIVEYVAAYHAASPLYDDERQILTDLIVSRMAMSTLISTWRASLHPGNSAYILRNVPSAWAGLEAIVPGDRRLEIDS